MKDQKTLLLVAVALGGFYLYNKSQEEKQYAYNPQQPYYPQQPQQQQVAYQPNTMDKINTTVQNINNLVNAGQQIWNNVSGLFQPPYTPPQIPAPRPAGNWA